MLVNRSTHSLWRVWTDEQQSMAAKEASGPAFLAPHPSHLAIDPQRSTEHEKYECGTDWYGLHLDEKHHGEDGDDDDDDSNGDYADVLSPDYYIDRRHIQISESLGNGQFGEVYRGMLKVRSSGSIHSCDRRLVERSTTGTEHRDQNL